MFQFKFLSKRFLTAGISLLAMLVVPLAYGQNFGPNVVIFNPSMSTSQIQTQVNAIAARQVNNEFGTQRFTFLFRPGTYGSAAQPLMLQVGYYTEIAGLGASPNNVVINGHIDVY